MKKTTPRKRRSDSAAAAVKAQRNAASALPKPPKHLPLPVEAKPYWADIMRARTRDAWLEVDLVNAVELACLYADIARLRELIRDEGDIIKGKPHPAHKLLNDAGRRAVSLSRVLHVHVEATAGRAQDAGNALQKQRQAEQAMQQHDPLIPHLRVVQ